MRCWHTTFQVSLPLISASSLCRFLPLLSPRCNRFFSSCYPHLSRPPFIWHPHLHCPLLIWQSTLPRYSAEVPFFRSIPLYHMFIHEHRCGYRDTSMCWILILVTALSATDRCTRLMRATWFGDQPAGQLVVCCWTGSNSIVTFQIVPCFNI